jgi:DNA polymerase elongation subunit (family B)
MPDHYFLETDKLYYSGQIDKLSYWSKLVEITLEVIAKIRDEVNKFFTQDNGTNFLTMAFEEVLFPVLFASKKKYVGIAHEHHPSFNKPLDINLIKSKFIEEVRNKFSEYTPEQIQNTVDDLIIAKRKKQFFIRGLDVVKRGMPNFAKEIILDILEEMVNINNIQELYDLVCEKIKQIYNTEWNHPELLYKFIMTDQFKPHKKNQNVRNDRNIFHALSSSISFIKFHGL